MSEPTASFDPLGSPLARAVFEAATEGMLVLSAEGRVLAMNGAFGCLYGIEPEAMVGRHHSAFTADLETRQGRAEIGPESWVMSRALRGERVAGVVQTIRNRRTGIEFFARWGASPLFEEGRLVAATITVEDATEAVRAQQRIEGALSAAEVGTWRVDLRSERAWGDRNYARLYGMGDDEVQGVPVQRLFDPVHPDDRERIGRELGDVADAHESEFRIVLPDGAVRWVLLRGRVERDDKGLAVQRVGSIVDLTRQKASEADALRAVARYRTLAEVAATVVFAADAQGGLTEIPLARGLYTDDKEVGLGEGWLSAVHADDQAAAAEAWVRALSTGEPYQAEFRLLMADGAYRWHAARGVRVLEEGGKTREWVGALTDVHERIEAERSVVALNAELDERVRLRTEELTRANRDLDEFAYSVAHDLRAPLRAIVSSSRIVLEDASERLTSEERSELERQAKNGVRLARLIDDLLRFARLANAELQRAPFDMTVHARAVATEVLGHGWSPLCVIEVQDGMRAVGDARLVDYALANLLDNACKFSPGGGKIEVGESDGAFFVRDRGIGFDPQYAPKLFVAFERLVDMESYPGTGVGLANVKRIVERHGGRVWAQSEPGKGATFWFTLAPTP